MKLCVALDLPTKDANLQLAKQIKNYDIWLKIGFRAYIRDGKEFINELKQINQNFKIFLDLKLYDIPNTMADASCEIAKLGVDMFNIHASAGRVAMQTVMKRIEKFQNRPLVLAVTALTSFNNETFGQIYNDSIKSKAISMAKLSYECGLDGVVCSAFESEPIKTNISNKFITLTPGIRPFDTNDKDDQARVANIEFARNNLVDFVVVGRPIYKSNNPTQKVKLILEQIEKLC